MTQQVSISLIYDWPRQLTDYSFFDIGSHSPYFSKDELKAFSKWHKLSGQKQINQIIESQLPVSLYFSGPFVELLDMTAPKQIQDLKTAVKKGVIEMLGGTFHHTLSSLYNPDHFITEVKWHKQLMKEKFGTKPTRFFNTENVYYNALAPLLYEAGFKSCFAGTVEWYLSDHQDQRIFRSKDEVDFKLLLIAPDQGESLFEENEIKNYFIQLSHQQLSQLGGWETVTKKVKRKGDLVPLNAHTVKHTPVYHIRQPISGKYQDLSLDSYIRHPLQESWLKQLYAIAPTMATSPEVLKKKWSALGSLSLLTKLNPELRQEEGIRSYESFHSLINILSDLQIED